jgi:hypothetical protein
MNIDTINVVKPPVEKIDAGDSERLCTSCKFFKSRLDLNEGKGECENEDWIIENMALIHKLKLLTDVGESALKMTNNDMLETYQEDINVDSSNASKELLNVLKEKKLKLKKQLKKNKKLILNLKQECNICHIEEADDCKYFQFKQRN